MEGPDQPGTRLLTDSQWDRMTRYGIPEQTSPGDILISDADRWYSLILVESGAVAVVRESLSWTAEATVAELGARSFVGELGLLNGQRAYLTARVTRAGRVHRVNHESLRRMMAEDDELCDLLLRELWARREKLRAQPTAGTLQIIGGSRSRESLTLQRYVERLQLVHAWVDEDDPDAIATLARRQLTSDDLPVAILQEDCLRRVTSGRLAERMGLAFTAEDDLDVDLAVIGAGPAGLAAAISAASEGLRTVLLDSVAPGGQSGATARIENYLGFPYGVSGDALTAQASLQALKFGVRLVAPCSVVALSPGPDRLELTLADGASVHVRAAIVSTGVAYRALELDRWKEFEGAGIHYSASELEVRQAAGNEVVVLGGANSAGQAALTLAASGCHVHLVVRALALEARMSSYLIARITEHAAITVHTDTLISAVHGQNRLEQITLTTPARGGGHAARTPNRTITTPALFCFIGAQPASEWITGIRRDEHGFILTGSDVTHLGSDWRPLDRGPLPFETSVPRVFAAGDVRHGSVKRIAGAVGEGSSTISSVHRALNPNPRG